MKIEAKIRICRNLLSISNMQISFLMNKNKNMNTLQRSITRTHQIITHDLAECLFTRKDSYTRSCTLDQVSHMVFIKAYFCE